MALMRAARKAVSLGVAQLLLGHSEHGRQSPLAASETLVHHRQNGPTTSAARYGREVIADMGLLPENGLRIGHFVHRAPRERDSSSVLVHHMTTGELGNSSRGGL